MPTVDEAIERAAWALYEIQGLQAGLNPPWVSLNASQREPFLREAKATLSAFLADVPVSEGMTEIARDNNGLGPITSTRLLKAMSAKLAEEIQ